MKPSPLLARNPRIDSLRGWGCLLILILHSVVPYNRGRDLLFPESDLTDLGTNIVSLFFCISGYLVFQSLDTLSKHQHRYKRIFYIRRFFRIIPLWWFLITVMYLLGAFSKAIFLSQFFFYFGFLYYMPAYLPIVPAWSLFVEENFYLILPWIHHLMNNLKKASIAFIVSVALCILWRNGAPLLGVPTENYFISRSILFKMPFFISGIFLLHLERVFVKKGTPYFLQNKITMSVLGLIAFIMLFHHYYLYALLAVPVLCFVWIQPRNLFSFTEHSQLLRFAGERCYAIYIFHAPISTLIYAYKPFLTKDLPLKSHDLRWFFIHATLVVTLSLLVSVFSYYLIEQPFLRWGYRLSNRWKDDGHRAILPGVDEHLPIV